MRLTYKFDIIVKMWNSFKPIPRLKGVACDSLMGCDWLWKITFHAATTVAMLGVGGGAS